jgi:CBS domain containing-hemolysin-like protein
MSKLGRLARMGDAAEVDGVRLKVTKMDGRRVARVRVTVLDSAGSSGSAEAAESDDA